MPPSAKDDPGLTSSDEAILPEPAAHGSAGREGTEAARPLDRRRQRPYNRVVKKAPVLTFSTTREGIEARLGELELKVDRLRSMYESYFMGMERMPPNALRRDMNRMMLELQQVPISNASLRFRFQALSQKWVLHTTYWNRTMREIEAGTYRRDMARAQRHFSERGGVLTEEQAIAIGIPKNRVKAFVARQQLNAAKKTASHAQATIDLAATSEAPAVPETVPGAPSAPTPPRPGPPPIPAYARRSPNPDAPAPAPELPGLSESDFNDAYERYCAAHRELGRSEEVSSKDRLRARLGKQLPKILAEKRCERLRLEVAVEDGKVRLRAWPASSPQK
jgi:hypothetical protein